MDNFSPLIASLHFVDLYFWIHFNFLRKMVSTRKKKHQHKSQLNELNETLNEFVIGNETNASTIGKGILELHINSGPIILERVQSVKTLHVNLKLLKTILTTNIERRLIVLLWL